MSTSNDELRQIVTDALVAMISGVTGLVPPSGPGSIPDFVQAPIDRAVEKISSALPVGVPDVQCSAKALIEREAKMFSLNAAGMFDSGAPEHRQTIAIVELLKGFDEGEAEDHWEAIMAYSDLRASDALFRAAELLGAGPGGDA